MAPTSFPPNPVMDFSDGPAPPASVDPKFAKLQAVLDTYEVSIAEAHELTALEDYELLVIADDSGSMTCPAAPPSHRQLGVKSTSRWEELKETVSLMVELGTCFDESGMDIFFLNRGQYLRVKSSSSAEFRNAFWAPPKGTTPLTETLQRVSEHLDGDKPVLIVILTDGEPNGGAARFCAELGRIVKNPRKKVRVQIMACTGDDDAISWMNAVDRQYAEVDVTDDYYSEKVQVLQKVRRVNKFTRGDWVMKAMLGPVSHKFDGWDERHARQAMPRITMRTQSFHDPCKCSLGGESCAVM